MNKKIILIVICLILASSTVLASPLTDYSKGKLSVDLNYRYSQNTVSDFEGSWDYAKKYNIEPSITVGLGNKWAFQYRGVYAKSGVQHWGGGEWGKANMTVSEFNALYQLGPNISGFAGFVSAKGTLKGYELPDGAYDDSGRKNTWQLGLVGYKPLTDKVTVYGVLGAGGKWVNYEVGLSYAFTKNLEINLDYRYLKVRDLEFDGYKFHSNTKGLGFGVTYKL